MPSTKVSELIKLFSSQYNVTSVVNNPKQKLKHLKNVDNKAQEYTIKKTDDNSKYNPKNNTQHPAVFSSAKPRVLTPSELKSGPPLIPPGLVRSAMLIPPPSVGTSLINEIRYRDALTRFVDKIINIEISQNKEVIDTRRDMLILQKSPDFSSEADKDILSRMRTNVENCLKQEAQESEGKMEQLLAQFKKEINPGEITHHHSPLIRAMIDTASTIVKKQKEKIKKQTMTPAVG